MKTIGELIDAGVITRETKVYEAHETNLWDRQTKALVRIRQRIESAKKRREHIKEVARTSGWFGFKSSV